MRRTLQFFTVLVVCAVLVTTAATGAGATTARWIGTAPQPIPDVKLGPHRVAVILASFGNATLPITIDQARSAVFTGPRSARALYQESSQGRITLVGALDPQNGDVFGTYTIPATSYCDKYAYDENARASAEADGFVDGNYDSVVVVFPYRPDCGFYGESTLDADPGTVWVNGTLYGAIVAHEIGHNYGLEHASSLALCTAAQRRTMSSACAPNEYGDPVDVMSHSYEHDFNAWEQYELGLLGPRDVQVVTRTGTYSLAASETATHTLPRLLLVPSRVASEDPVDTAGHAWLALDLRAPSGTFDNFSPNDPVVKGVSVRRVQLFAGDDQSYLLDRTPTTSTVDAPYPAGSIFRATPDRVSIKVLSARNGQAIVHVQLG